MDFQLTLPLQQIRELFLVADIIQRAVGELCLQRPKLTVEVIYLALQLFLAFAQRSLALPFCGGFLPQLFLVKFLAGIAGPHGRRSRFEAVTGRFLFAQPLFIIFQIAFEFSKHTFVDGIERINRVAEQMAVMRDDDQRSGVVLQGNRERVNHIQIEVVGGLIHQQQVRLTAHDPCQREAGFFTTRKNRYLLIDALAPEIKAAKVVANLLSAGFRIELLNELKRS